MISAIVPFRDWSVERLETCIARLRNLPSITETILVDFGSRKPLAAVAGCRVVRVDADRWCLSEANNIGIAEARNEVVLKIDADVQLLVDDDTLKDLAGTVAKGEVTFCVLQPTDFQYRDGRPARKRLRPEWAEGCGNLINRAEVLKIGGFDTRFFDYGGEDNDICQRLRRFGKRVEYYKSDRVLHERHPPSEARVSGRFTDAQKKALLADHSIFRPHPFRYSDYKDGGAFGPAITVAIATTDRANRAEHLAYCLKGLAAQTFRDFEVRICENGSPRSARLKEAALRKAFPTLDIHLHQLDEPSIPKARNLITANARGFYIAVHDDDDFSLPTRFEDQLQCLASEEGAHGCHSSWIEFDEETGSLKSHYGQSRDIEKLMRQPGKVTLHGTALYRRDVLVRVPYDESLVLSSDHHLHVRMTLAGIRIPHTSRFHVLRRLHRASVSATGTAIQRDTADGTNGAYRFFVGAPFLAAVRAQSDEGLWVSGFPTQREMLGYLPPDFGAFRIDLSLEASLAVGFDPVFGAADRPSWQFTDLDFVPACRGYCSDTRLVMRSSRCLTAGEMLERLDAFRELPGIDIVSDVELANQPAMQSLEMLRLEKGQRRVISRRYADMAEALRALPGSLLASRLGRIEFFAVNDPAPGVHILLGTYDNAADLEYALGLANAGGTGDFMAVSNLGLRGGFHGP